MFTLTVNNLVASVFLLISIASLLTCSRIHGVKNE